MKTPQPLKLGDMELADVPPARLLQAIAVISRFLHDTLDSVPVLAVPGKSRISCILCSLVVRDFLFRGGFRSAEFRPVVVAVQAVDKDGGFLHSLAIGNPEGPDPATTDSWDGHAVVIVDGWLIDTTLYQANRKQWPNLPGMMTVPMLEPGRELFGLPLLTGVVATGPDDSKIDMAWLDQPMNRKWRAAPDAQRPHNRRRVVDYLLQQFAMKDLADA